MLIAVATDNRVDVAPHLGKAQYFLLYEVEEGRFRIKGAVKNPHAEVHAREEKEGGHRHDHAHGHTHSHDDLFQLLSGCDATISRGIGPKMAGQLRDQGIEPYILDEEASNDNAVAMFLAGEIRPVADRR